MPASPTIIWTHTDEAPALATYSFLPIVRAFTAATDLQLELSDISLAARILAVFSDRLDEHLEAPVAGVRHTPVVCNGRSCIFVPKAHNYNY